MKPIFYIIGIIITLIVYSIFIYVTAPGELKQQRYEITFKEYLHYGLIYIFVIILIGLFVGILFLIVLSIFGQIDSYTVNTSVYETISETHMEEVNGMYIFKDDAKGQYIYFILDKEIDSLKSQSISYLNALVVTSDEVTKGTCYLKYNENNYVIYEIESTFQKDGLRNGTNIDKYKYVFVVPPNSVGVRQYNELFPDDKIEISE